MNDRYILGSQINDISLEQAIKSAEELLVAQGVHFIVTPNSEICLKGYKNEKLRSITKEADLSLPDGFGLKIGGFILGQNINNIVTGVDFSYALFNLAEKKNYSVLLIGGKGKSGTKAVENLKIKHPKLRAQYLNGGIFDEQGNSEFPDFLDKINQIKPDIILVNLGAPKQEYFMFNNRHNLDTKLMIGVGGTIDFLAGNVRRAPKWINRIGMEWFYRLIQEPWRWKRIFNAVILFPLACIWWKIRNLTIYRRSAVGFIINEKKEILLMKRTSRAYESERLDHWQLPQGGIEKSESPTEAVLREMREETGLTDLKVLNQVMNSNRYNWDSTSQALMPFKGQSQSLFLLLHSGQNNEVTPDKKEFADYKWVNKDQVLGLANPRRRGIISIGLDKFKDQL